MNGILPLWKPIGMTSHDCITRLRHVLHIKKMGHTGTLDPGAEGVLPICIGEATKIVPYLTDTPKTYIATVRLGVATDTDDRYGSIIHENAMQTLPSQAAIENVLQSLNGNTLQQAPIYSAVKVNGKKLYEYARANEFVERPYRSITIYEIVYVPEENTKDPYSFTIKVRCGKGTYIRTLCADIGEQLGYYAHMSDLQRVQSGPIDKSGTFTFEQVEAAVSADKQTDLLLSASTGVRHLDTMLVDQETSVRVLNGQKLNKPEQTFKTEPFKVMHGEKLIALYKIHPDNAQVIKPVRVFHMNGEDNA